MLPSFFFTKLDPDANHEMVCVTSVNICLYKLNLQLHKNAQLSPVSLQNVGLKLTQKLRFHRLLLFFNLRIKCLAGCYCFPKKMCIWK